MEVHAGDQAAPLQHRPQLAHRRPRVRRRLEHDELARAQALGDLGCGTEQDRQVGLALARERRRQRDQDRVRGAERVVVRRRDEPVVDERAEHVARDVLDVAVAAVEPGDPRRIDVHEHDGLARLAEHLRERDPDVPGAHDGDVARADLDGSRQLGCRHVLLGGHRAPIVPARARAIRSEAWPSPYKHGPLGRHPGLGHGRDDAVGIVVDQHVGALLDRVDPLGRGAQRHAGHAVPVGLLLEPAGIGCDHPGQRLRARRTGGSRAAHAPRRGRRTRCPRSPARRAFADAPGRRRDPAAGRARLRSAQGAAGRRSPRGGRWRRHTHRRGRPGTAAARSARTACSRRPSRRRRRRSGPVRLRRGGFAASVRPARTGAGARRSTSIRLRSSGIARSPLRSPASTCASGTPAALAARAPASVEFVSPYTSTQSGRSARTISSIGRLHGGDVCGVEVEPVVGLAEAELLEEDLGQLAVPVLAGVGDDLLDSRFAQCDRERCALDELWSVADDGEDFHEGGGSRGNHGFPHVDCCGRLPTTERIFMKEGARGGTMGSPTLTAVAGCRRRRGSSPRASVLAAENVLRMDVPLRGEDGRTADLLRRAQRRRLDPAA